MNVNLFTPTNRTSELFNTSRTGAKVHSVCYTPLLEGYVIITISITLAIIGSVLNVLVCFAILASPNLRKLQNYLIVNLSIGDLMLTALSLPLYAVHTLGETTGSCMDILSRIRGFLLNTSIVVSIATLTAISVERFVVIVWPFKYRFLLTTRRIIVVIVTMWIVACCYGAAIATDLHIYSATVNVVFNMLSLSSTIACYVIIVLCYVLILIKSLRKTKIRKNMAPNQSETTHRRVAVTVALIITAFTVTWGPFVTFSFVAFDSASFKIAELLAQSNAVINTLIYFYRTKEFRFELRRVFRSRIRSRRTQRVDISARQQR